MSAAPLMTAKQAAERLATTEGTLATWRSSGRNAIPFIRVGRSVRYDPADLDAYLASQRFDGCTKRVAGAAAC